MLGLGLAAAALPRVADEAALLGLAGNRDAPAFAQAVEDGAWLSERPYLRAGRALIEDGYADDRTVRLLRRAVTLAPGRADAWTSLAYALERQQGPVPAAARALRLSVQTGPFDLETTSYRLDMALRLWEAFDRTDWEVFGTLVRTQWAWGPGRLTEITVKYGAAPLVRPHLAPADLAEFNRRCQILDRQCRP